MKQDRRASTGHKRHVPRMPIFLDMERPMLPMQPKFSADVGKYSGSVAESGSLVSIRDLDEAINVVGSVYCPHTVEPAGPARSLNVDLKVITAADQPVVYLRYSSPVAIDAGRFPNLLLMMSASSGAASVDQNGRIASWRAGQTMPLSPGRETVLKFDGAFAQTALRVDIDRLERMCAAWLGYPLERPIAFDLQPLPHSLEVVWQDAVRLVCTLASSGMTLPKCAVESLDEFLLSTILHAQRHSYSGELARPVAAGTPRIVASAKQMFSDRAEEGTTVAKVARELGVSVRTLQAGFQKSDQTTPSAFLRKVRLEAAHRMLTAATAATSVTDVALHLGFTHAGRFSADYRAAFGEAPIATMRRCRQR
ncbi:helix-turn-helix domain-containing protein [Paraburkholderia sp. D1E]|uniref:helix-turn-helix domain-containing protein n=1 Tax=Paraburkholderia sp. D1E TaxID=3461398 RepID=UPI00404541C3